MIDYSPTESRPKTWLEELWEMEQKLNLYIYTITEAPEYALCRKGRKA